MFFNQCTEDCCRHFAQSRVQGCGCLDRCSDSGLKKKPPGTRWVLLFLFQSFSRFLLYVLEETMLLWVAWPILSDYSQGTCSFSRGTFFSVFEAEDILSSDCLLILRGVFWSGVFLHDSQIITKQKQQTWTILLSQSFWSRRVLEIGQCCRLLRVRWHTHQVLRSWNPQSRSFYWAKKHFKLRQKTRRSIFTISSFY